jgi:hypothetical protein
MAISNFNGTTAKSFKIGDITVYSGLTPYDYNDLGENGDIFISTDGTRYSKADGKWQIQMNQWTGTEVPDNTLGENGDLYRLLSTDGISGSKYIKVDDSTIEPYGIKWLATTNELYSNVPNDELFNELDFYAAGDGDYVKIDGRWVKVQSHLEGDELPVAKIGNNGDIYHETTLDKYYFKSDGKWYNVTARYVQTDTPDSTYGVNNDIWLGNDNLTVYVREGNDWTNKTSENKVSGGNGVILDDFYPDKTIITAFNRTYYVKLETGWQEVGKIYHAESIPQSYHGLNGDICLNNNNSMVWVKDNGVWSIGNLMGIINEPPASDYGYVSSVVYTQTSQQYIANDKHIYSSTIKTYTDVPTATDGSIGDIYNVNSSVYYKNDDNEWHTLGNSYNYQSAPIACNNDNLNGYLYIVQKDTPDTYVCDNRNWHLIDAPINGSTPPSGFTASANDIYVTTDDNYYVYTTDWMATIYKTYESDPDETCGVDNDIYIMADKRMAKMNGVWVNISSGQSLDGHGIPDPNIGDVNDIYTDLDSNIKYIKVEIDLWNEVGNEYRYDTQTPPITFWTGGTIYVNASNEAYVKSDIAWNPAGIIFDAREGTLPPVEYWNDYTVYELDDTKHIKYNNTWNDIQGTLTSTDIPNNYMWEEGVIYNNSTTDYIKTGSENWTENGGVYNADAQPAPTYWGTNIIYITSTRKYINTSGIWENVILEVSTYELPTVNNGANGMVWLSPDYNYYLKISGVWRRISNVFDKNTAPRYNSFGLENSIYELANGNAFVKQNGIWNQALNIIEGEDAPFNDVGTIGTLFDLSTDGKTYTLYYDYNWKLLGNAYTPNDNPLDTDGEYLWLYIKSDTSMVYKNETTWVDVSEIIKSNNQPTQDEGEVNNVWITLSTGLYVKDSGEWSKIATAGQQEFNARQEIYLFT